MTENKVGTYLARVTLNLSYLGNMLSITSTLKSMKSLFFYTIPGTLQGYVCKSHHHIMYMKEPVGGSSNKKYTLMYYTKVVTNPEDKDDPEKLRYLSFRECEGERSVKELVDEPTCKI